MVSVPRHAFCELQIGSTVSATRVICFQHLKTRHNKKIKIYCIFLLLKRFVFKSCYNIASALNVFTMLNTKFIISKNIDYCCR